MKLIFFFSIISVLLPLLYVQPSSASSLFNGTKLDGTDFANSVPDAPSIAYFSPSANNDTNTKRPLLSTTTLSTMLRTLSDKPESDVRNPSSSIANDDTRTGENTLDSIAPTAGNEIQKSETTIKDNSKNSTSPKANSTTSPLTLTSTESSNSNISSGVTPINNSANVTKQCPDMCYCPDYEHWVTFLLPYLRRQLGSRAKNYTDYVLKLYLYQQFATNAESLKSMLGHLFYQVMSDGNVEAILFLHWARFGVTTCTIKANTTFYLNADAESRLFPQTHFKAVQIEFISKTLNQWGNNVFTPAAKEDMGSDKKLESHEMYNITFVCHEGSRVVITEETSLYRYGRWSSTRCQVVTEGTLTMHRNWSLIELALNSESDMWFQNITMSKIKDEKANDTRIPSGQNTTVSNDSQTSVGFPSFPIIQDFSFANSSLTVPQLGQILVWFQNAETISLKNNSLGNFNCSQLIRAPANWSRLKLSYNGLEAVPPCILRKSLEILDLSNNSISDISVFQFPRFVPCPNLDSLDLSYNNITDVGIFSDMKVFMLYLAGNKISFLNRLSFTRLPNLSVLDLSRNHLHQLHPGSFKSLIYLRNLNLQHNFLDKLDGAVSPLRIGPPLNCTIDLRHNRFSHPPFQSQGYNPGTELYLYANNNPFACDCAMSAFASATNNSSLTKFYLDRRDMQCVHPFYLNGQPLDDMVFTDTCPVVSHCPAGCTCTLHRNDSTVVIDCAGVQQASFPETFPNNHKLQLEFQSANNTPTFSTFQDNEYLHRVVSVNASGRGLTTIPDFLCESLKQGEVLDLSYNRLQHLPACFQSRPIQWPVLEIRLGHNPWSCDCNAVNLSSWLAEMMDGRVKNGVRVSDARDVWCSNDTDPGVRVAEWDSSHCIPLSYLLWAVSLGVVLALAAVLGPLLYFYRLQAMVVLHDRFHIRPFTRMPHYNEDDYDHEFLVIHGKSNLAVDWVLNSLLPRTNDTQHRVCVPDRDFLLGMSTAESYASSIARAKATLCLVSVDAARDDWWLYAFQLACAENARQPQMKFLMVMLEPVEEDQVPREVQEFIKANTYLSAHDHWFWKKLFFYLPDPPKVELL